MCVTVHVPTKGGDMGHDLDQVVIASQGALADLKRQRDDLDQQIAAIETLLKFHTPKELEVTVHQNGVVDEVKVVEAVNVEVQNEPRTPGPYAHHRTQEDEALDVVLELKKAVNGTTVAAFSSLDAKEAARALNRLERKGLVSRVKRGTYVVSR